MAAFTSPGASAFSMLADSTLTPFCWARRPSQPTSVSKGALASRTDRLPGPPGSLPARRRTVDDHEQRFTRGCRRGGGGGQFGGDALHPGEIGVLAGETLVRMRDAAIEGNHHAEEEDRRREREAPREQAPVALGKGGEGVERQ